MVTSGHKVKATAVQPAPSGGTSIYNEPRGSDHPWENLLQALCGVVAVRAAEVALGQDKVQSGVPRQKLVATLT